jgi:hypothetical protein
VIKFKFVTLEINNERCHNIQHINKHTCIMKKVTPICAKCFNKERKIVSIQYFNICNVNVNMGNSRFISLIYSFIKHTPAIATESFIDVFFTISLTTCFGPFRPSSGETHYIIFSHTSPENYRYLSLKFAFNEVFNLQVKFLVFMFCVRKCSDVLMSLSKHVTV